MVDINVDENIISFEKIALNSKPMNHLNTSGIFANNQILYSTIKCYKNLPSITTFEAKGKNIIKIHKTIYLNLSNLTSIDLRENKLQKISKNFRLFKNLKTLRLDSNNITFIPSFINELNQLETFTISNNQLSYLPTTIQDLNKLQKFSFSNNKIDKLPIEFGLLNSLQILYMDCNYFTAIPTTLCYLKKLNELSLDWLEFVDPPYFRNIKDSVGKTIILIIQKSLGNMLKQSILFCDFKTFVEKISPKKSVNNDNNNINNNQFNELNDSMNNNSNNHAMKNSSSQQGGTSVLTIKSNSNNIYVQKYAKIFNAIENNYYGIVKALLESENVEEYLTVKNIENKTPLYLSLTKNNDLINLFLSKMKEKNIEINYTYLFKAIYLRNPELVKKLINLGVRTDSIDDQGRGAFHILFNVFNNQLSKCVIIGDFLLSKGTPVNKFDNDNSAPVHVASRRGCKECLLWIISRNVYLAKEGREQFDLNLKGKNNCTPLHYTISNFRIEETLILLEHGCDIFARNVDAQTPKKISSSNFVFSKLLTHYEAIVLGKKYNVDDDEKIDDNDKKKICHTLLDEEVENTDNNNVVTTMNNNKNYSINNVDNKNNISFGNINYNINNIIIQNNYSININNNLVKNQRDTDLKKKYSENLLQISINNNQNNQNPTLQKTKTSDNIASFSKGDIIPFVESIELFNNNNNIIKTTDPVVIHDNTVNNENVCMNINININNNITKIKKEKINNNKKENQKNDQNNIYDNSYNKSNIENMNINNQKEVLSSCDYSPFKKYESFKIIQLNKNDEIDIIKNILDNIDFENSFNLMILSDLCNFCIANLLFNITPILKKLLSNGTIQKKTYIKNEIIDTIKLLEELSKNQNLNALKKSQKIKKSVKKGDTGKLNVSKKQKEDNENEEMFYQNSEEVNNTDEIEDSVNNINFDEINNLFINTNKTNKEEKNKDIENNNKDTKNTKPIIVDVKIKEKKVVNKNNKLSPNKGNKILKKSKKNNKNKKTFTENIKEIQAQLMKTNNIQQHNKQGSVVVKNNCKRNKGRK